jgi:hypothetical protein
MIPDNSFDLNAFAQTLAGFPVAERAGRVEAEVQRVRAMTVRDAARRFDGQMYVQHLERLGRALSGHDVGGELTPSERPVHALLLGCAPQAVAAAAALESSAPSTATPPPAPSRQSTPPDSPAAPAMAVAAVETTSVEAASELSGAERRTSRRIQMKTRVRIRRDSDNVCEVLEPVNVSRGGLGFQSCKRFALHETVWATMHYQPGSDGIPAKSASRLAGRSKALALDAAAEIETKSIIVRAAAMANSIEFSYGLKFL